MHRLVSDYTHHFAFGMHDLGRHTTHQMRLELAYSKPVFCPRHRLSRVEWDTIDSNVKELAKIGLIKPATYNYDAATVLPVKKDADENYTGHRICGDCIMFNLKTKLDTYPMPIREDIFDNIEGCQYVTSHPLSGRHNQLREYVVTIQPADQQPPQRQGLPLVL